MAERLLMMLRQQKTAVGKLMPGVAYRFDMRVKEQADVAERLLNRKFAEPTTEEALAEAKIEAEALAEKPAAKKASGSKKSQAKASAADKD